MPRHELGVVALVRGGADDQRHQDAGHAAGAQLADRDRAGGNGDRSGGANRGDPVAVDHNRTIFDDAAVLVRHGHHPRAVVVRRRHHALRGDLHAGA